MQSVYSICLCSGSILDWTIIYSDLATLGSVSATCSDGNILAPITYGFNDSSTGDCDNYLDSSSFATNPSGSGNFGYRQVLSGLFRLKHAVTY